MNHQRRRQLADAEDALNNINQMLPRAVETIATVLQAEKTYADNIPHPLKGSRKALEANRVVKELQAAFNQLRGVNMMSACHAVAAALEAPAEVPTFGEDREGVQLRTAASHALEALSGGARGKRRTQVVEELQAALQ